MRALIINDNLSIIPVFLKDKANRLTESGMEVVEVITCTLYEAKGMEPLASGTAMRVPEDSPNDAKGCRIALGRALKHMGCIMTDFEREWVMDILNWEIDANSPKKTVMSLKKFLNNIHQQMVATARG